MIKLDQDKVISSGVDDEAAEREADKLEEEVAGSTKGIQDEPDPDQPEPDPEPELS